jgi:O-antigen/teichoic acid export membrane protein
LTDSAVRMARGASFLVFDTSFSALVGIVAFALISRLLTKNDMGVMTVLLMLTSTCQLVSTLGLPSASTKFIAEFLGREDTNTASAVASQILKVNSATAAFMSMLCFGLSEALSELLLGTTQYTLIFQVLALNIFFSSLLPGLTGVLLGLKRLRDLAVFGAASFSIQQALVVALLLSRMDLLGVVIGWTVANMFNCAVFLWVIGQSVHLSIAGQFDLKVLLRYSWPLYPVAFVSLIDNWFDRVLLLGYSLSDLGAYNVAFKAFGYLYAVPIAIADGFFPHFSELTSREGLDRLSTILTSTSRYLVLVATPLALQLATMATPMISIFAGRIYASAGQYLTVLCIAAAISVFGLMLGKVLLVLDETRLYAIIVLTTVLIGLGLGKVLVPLFGPLGASFARATSMILTLIFLVGATSRKLRLRIDTQALWKSWVAGLVMAGILILVQLIAKSAVLIPVYVVLGMLVYMLSLRMLHAVVDKDLEFLKRFLGNKIGSPVSRLLKTVLIPRN